MSVQFFSLLSMYAALHFDRRDEDLFFNYTSPAVYDYLYQISGFIFSLMAFKGLYLARNLKRVEKGIEIQKYSAESLGGVKSKDDDEDGHARILFYLHSY
jgi:hypothetical protein